MNLTKTLNFEPDALEVIRKMAWDDTGTLGIITGGQLDRALYAKVNKALEALGGKWNRKAGGHVFAKDPRAALAGLLDSGALQVARDGFFETPSAVIERMFEHRPPSLNPLAWTLEPSAGAGAIVKALIDASVPANRITAIEKNPDRADLLADMVITYCIDFLDFRPPVANYHRIYMNPPFEFGQDIDHVLHAYELLTPGGCLVAVMSEGSFSRNDHKAMLFRNYPFHAAYSEILPPGSFKSSGTGVNTRLFVADK